MENVFLAVKKDAEAILKNVIKYQIHAVGPVTAKQVHKYLHSQGIGCDMHEIAEQVTTLIREGEVRLGDEGNTFDRPQR